MAHEKEGCIKSFIKLKFWCFHTNQESQINAKLIAAFLLIWGNLMKLKKTSMIWRIYFSNFLKIQTFGKV